MKKTKILLIILLIIALLAIIVLAGAGIVFVFYLETLKSTHGIAPIAAFIIAAVFAGGLIQKVVERIKRIWQ